MKPSKSAIKTILVFALAILPLAGSASAFDITDLIPKAKNDTTSGSSSGTSLFGKLGDILGDVLGKTELKISDITGEWQATGPAITFKSDNLLSKVGGAAGASAIESKIKPYYDKLGMENAILTIYTDSSFSFKNKKLTLKGTIIPQQNGSYLMKFSAAGLFNFGNAETYLQKSGSSLKVMFDATTLKNIANGLAKMSGVGIAQTAVKLLDSYDGICIGIDTKKVGNVEAGASAFSLGTKKTETSTSTSNDTTSSTKEASSSKTDKKAKLTEALSKLKGLKSK